MIRLPTNNNILPLVLLLVGLQQLGSAGYIYAKAHLAQLLIGNAWAKSLVAGGGVEKPWPWADTWPVARLEVPRHQVDLYVLAGTSGNALAFGPGYDRASARPGLDGVTVIGGHRDTHFEFLQEIETNTLLSLHMASGERRTYQVSGSRVVNTDHEPYLLPDSTVNELLLVTCYPFDALAPGGPLRFVVSARPVLTPHVAVQPRLSRSPLFQTQQGDFEL